MDILARNFKIYHNSDQSTLSGVNSIIVHLYFTQVVQFAHVLHNATHSVPYESTLQLLFVFIFGKN